MAYFTHTVDPIGAFDEKEYGNPFEYSINDDTHVFAYVCVDEDDYGQPVVEKWHIKRHREYSTL